MVSTRPIGAPFGAIDDAVKRRASEVPGPPPAVVNVPEAARRVIVAASEFEVALTRIVAGSRAVFPCRRGNPETGLKIFSAGNFSPGGYVPSTAPHADASAK